MGMEVALAEADLAEVLVAAAAAGLVEMEVRAMGV
jgi:hypothetical protein